MAGRVIAYEDDQTVRLVSRQGKDLTRRFRGIIAALRKLDPSYAICY